MFIPTIYRDITPHLDKKIEIMGLFATETRPGIPCHAALRPSGRWPDTAGRRLASNTRRLMLNARGWLGAVRHSDYRSWAGGHAKVVLEALQLAGRA